MLPGGVRSSKNVYGDSDSLAGFISDLLRESGYESEVAQ